MGSWYLMRLRPYRTVDNRIDGVVVTFVDMTRRRQAEAALRHRVRNILSVVKAISYQTMRNSRDLRNFVARFDGRIDALEHAQVHKLLVGANWRRGARGDRPHPARRLRHGAAEPAAA